MSDAFTRLDGVTNVEMDGNKAVVTFDPKKTDTKKIIESFNSDGSRYKAKKKN